MSDLTDFEKIRIQNIQRNQNFLASIGISDNSTIESNKKSSNSKKRKSISLSDDIYLNVRRSKRLPNRILNESAASLEEFKIEVRTSKIDLVYRTIMNIVCIG